MDNSKVHVKNEAESKEVQELFFELGGSWTGEYGELNHLSRPFLYLTRELITFGSSVDAFNDHENKELTIQQLRDLVVLKRNCVDDATHTCDRHKYYLTASEFFEYINGYWENVDEYVDGCIFEPIEKEMKMKEYLNPLKAGGYELSNDALCNDSIEVPEGMNFAIKNRHGIYFFESSGLHHHRDLIWQRSETENTKQPTGIEATLAERKHSHYFKDVSQLDVIDIYDVLKLFEVTDPCLQHIIKKALCAGKRGHKDLQTDLQNIVDTAIRAVELNK